MDNVAGDEDHYGRVFVTTQGRGIPYGEPGTAPVSTPASLSSRHVNGLKCLGNRIVANAGWPMQLLDLQGRMVRQAMPFGNKVEMSLKGLMRGAYIARCGDETLFVGFRGRKR